MVEAVLEEGIRIQQEEASLLGSPWTSTTSISWHLPTAVHTRC